MNLATHTAGLPREISLAPAGTPHFTYPNFDQRWEWLPRHRLLTPPGTTALYSNVGFDFLADAIQCAAQKPYPRLLADRILKPLGMRDTTFTPTSDQCGRLLRGVKDEGPCTSTEGTDGSSGLYSTAADIARWLRYLVGDPTIGAVQNPTAQNIYILPAHLVRANGLNHAGRPTGIGLGWIRLGAAGAPSMILEKTGSGAGFHTYVALTPAEHTAIFIAFTASPDHAGHFDPFLAANNMLLALSNLPPIPEEPHLVATHKRVRRSRVHLAQPGT
jgi:D-alanyl-D-alanine-carboxypeptidase/D-alanyl-D-alanine-endopeptidase